MSIAQSRSQTHGVVEGFHSSHLSWDNHSCHLRSFLPTGYELRYPYPLVVFFHPRGSNEELVLKLAPHLSQRNYVCISLRGPERLQQRKDESWGYGWSCENELSDALEDNVLESIRYVRRNCHIHSERIYLAGFGEGADAAWRLGAQHPEKFAGVISLNGKLPSFGSPVLPFKKFRKLRAFLAHGQDNRRIPVDCCNQDFRLLLTAGLSVTQQIYPTTHRLHPWMLRDLNRWMMSHVDELPVD